MEKIKKKILLIDDEKINRDGFIRYLRDEAEVKAFKDPDDFSEKICKPEDLENIYLIVIDFKFNGYDARDKDVLTYIRSDLNYKGYIAIWSLSSQIPDIVSKKCDAVFPKIFLSMAEIEAILRNQS